MALCFAGSALDGPPLAPARFIAGAFEAIRQHDVPVQQSLR